MTKGHFNNDRGYTLAELTVGLAITAVIGTITAFLVISAISGLHQSRRTSEHVQATHTAWRHLSDELRRADHITLSDDGWSVSFADSAVSYLMTEEGLLRNDRPFAPAPTTGLIGRLIAVIENDTVRAHALDIATLGREDVTITTTVRRAPPATWQPLVDR